MASSQQDHLDMKSRDLRGVARKSGSCEEEGCDLKDWKLRKDETLPQKNSVVNVHATLIPDVKPQHRRHCPALILLPPPSSSSSSSLLTLTSHARLGYTAGCCLTVATMKTKSAFYSHEPTNECNCIRVVHSYVDASTLVSLSNSKMLWSSTCTSLQQQKR
jgi:hypothetical protein